MKIRLLAFFLLYSCTHYSARPPVGFESLPPDFESQFKCDTLTSRTISYEGAQFKKYNITQPGQLYCHRITETQTPRPWHVSRSYWTPEDEKDFQQFVRTLGKSTCRTLDECLSDEINPLRTKEDLLNHYYADCADLPYFLRAYFAYKKNLPWSMAWQIQSHDPAEKDLRYSHLGNKVLSRMNIPDSKFPNPDFGVVALEIINRVSTAYMRIQDGDLYSPVIDPVNITPGTLVYDHTGHVGVVFDVNDQGEIFLFDAHPDNSLTRSKFGRHYEITPMSLGGNFKKFKSYSFVNNEVQLAEAQNSSEDLQDKNFFAVVRQRLSGGRYRPDPVSEVKDLVEELCRSVQDRAISVQKAAEAKIHELPHPPQLPSNIYGTFGLWQTYSTAVLDLKLRHKISEIPKEAKNWILKYPHLKNKINSTIKEGLKNCNTVVQTSDLKSVTLNLNQIIKRAHLLSFDPYMCPELRWGIRDLSELKACADDPEKRHWYQYQQYFRDQLFIDTTAFHGFSLKQLKEKYEMEKH